MISRGFPLDERTICLGLLRKNEVKRRERESVPQRVMAALSLRSERPLSFEREAANERETHGLNPLKHSFSPLVTEITIFRRILFNTMIRHALRYMSVFTACF